jgi:stage III sporulation protein AA
MRKKNNFSRALSTVLSVLPGKSVIAITAPLSSLRGMDESLSEIRLRAEGECYLVADGCKIPLHLKLSEEELSELLLRLCNGSLYAYRDSISRGFVSMDEGVRVGVCGKARYDGERLVGVSRPTSLVFRIPSGICDYGDELYLEWLRAEKPNMIIISPPGVGKTTALRSLAAKIGGGECPMRVTVVDSRCEFVHSDYKGCSVDLLCGYERGAGIDIALRTLSAEVILVDEIGTEEESAAVLKAGGAGVKIIATAHADSPKSLRSRATLLPLLDGKVFSHVATVRRVGKERSFTVEALFEVAL